MRAERLTPRPWQWLGLMAVIKVVGTMAVADRYGWHRDELYYLASSKHPALGYVDYPPITPMLAALDQLIFPKSLPGLRLLTILAGAAVIVIAALIARELGGNATAQMLTGLAVLVSPLFIGSNLLFQTVSFDQLVWASACLVFVRLLNGASAREWLLLGLVFGVGLETKYTVIGLGVAIFLAILFSPMRPVLRTRWPWLGLAVALLLLLPNLGWQVTHNWDSIAYTINHHGSTDGPILYWVQQLLLAGPQLLAIMVMGAIWLWRQPRFRAAAITTIAVEVLFFAAGGKAYYPAPIYPLLYAAGTVWLVGAVRHRWVQEPLIALACAVTVILLPIGLPILPVQSSPWQARKDFADMVGWPDLTSQVTTVYQGLTPEERQSVMILASNYGEAGALDLYGKGLPPVVCAHLTYYYWAPAHMAPSTLIVVGYPRDYLQQIFGDVQQAGTVTNSYGIRNEEYGRGIWVIRQPRITLSQAWPQLKSLD